VALEDIKAMPGKDPDPNQLGFYARVPIRRPRAVSFAGAAPGAPIGVGIEAMEIFQSVQGNDNSVPMIAMKPTMVRLYLDPTSVTSSVNLRGELVWQTSPTGPKSYLPAINELKLDPAAAQPMANRRRNMRQTLNFRLPDDAIRAGKIYLEVCRLTQTGGADQPFNGTTELQADFVAAPPIRVRCVGLRYRDSNSGTTFTPGAVHFSYFRSFLHRAYPVPDVIWSQIVVDADFSAPFSTSTPVRANAQIAAIRNSEINSGTDPRTHYFGLVDDANGQNFMRGLASGIPQVPQPDTVASGPCGVPNGFAGDNDLSYADWYGAHELGHTFGRFHPGFPVGAQDASDPTFPYANGQLSDADGKFIGYDMGDPALGLDMKVLDGIEHHDVMTYADRQWVSAYTFEAIRQRLFDEDVQFAPAMV
jgi:hypothetical protein